MISIYKPKEGKSDTIIICIKIGLQKLKTAQPTLPSTDKTYQCISRQQKYTSLYAWDLEL